MRQIDNAMGLGGSDSRHAANRDGDTVIAWAEDGLQCTAIRVLW